MKRRNVESTKYRKQFHFRKCKFAEGMYGSSTFVYLKFLFIWILIMIADFLLEFRFEFLWPFWLVIRSLHDSFKYQGILFSMFFALVAFISDFICYMFLPVQWLFFAASTYVWVQYVWHTEKGICLPTISLWLLFVYIEASMRLKTLKTVDLCRPFAAHCIGYPMVTLGFGFKSYLSYKLRLKKQKEIQKVNEFHMQLIAKALPLELQLKDKEKFKTVNYEEEISSHQVLSNPSSSSIIGSLCNLTSQQQQQQQQQQPTSSYNKDKEKSIKSTSQTSINEGCSAPQSSSSNGLIASALSFYINSNSSNNSSVSNLEDLPYIQQKDSISNNKTAKIGKYNGSNESSTAAEKPNATDYMYNNSKSNSGFTNSNFSKSNTFANSNYNESNFSNNAKNKPNQQPEATQSSVNCNLSSFSISSLAYSATTEQSNESSNANINGSSVNAASMNGDINHHNELSNTTFLPANSNTNHTNININMTINATAIAAATATATATSPVSSLQASSKISNAGTNSNNCTSTKSRKNKDANRANSITASSSLAANLNNIAQTNSQKSNSISIESDMFSFKDNLINTLEEDLKKLREEIEQQKTVEQYLRNQISYVTKCDRSEKLKLEKLQQENKALQTKLNKQSLQTQKEKEDLDSIEKRLQDEKRVRQSLESQLAQEKKQREAQELQIQEFQKSALTSTNDTNNKKNEQPNNKLNCNAEVCRKKLKEMEIENKKLNDELRKKHDRIITLECEMKNLMKYRETEARVDTLMIALNLMEDKNASLQESLSAETRFKLDLFSALGETRRQLDAVNFQLKSKERELNAFKAIFKQSLSASPNFSNSVLNSYLNVNESSSLQSDLIGSNLLCNGESNVANILNGQANSSSPNLLTQNSSLASMNDWNNAAGALSFLPKI